MFVLTEVQVLISKYTGISAEIIKNLDSNEFPRVHPDSLNYLFIKRFHYNSLAINELIGNYIKDRNYKLPLFLVLRTCISDYLYFLYVDSIIRENSSDENREFEIKSVLVDNIRYLLRDLSDLKKNNEISDEKYKLSIHSIEQMYPEFFDLELRKPINCKNVNFSGIAKKLKKDSNYQDSSKAYDLYKFYSKFEHIGALTFDLSKNYDWYEKVEIHSIVMSITWIVHGLQLAISLVRPDIAFIEQLEEILDKIS